MRMVIRGVVALIILVAAYWSWSLAGPRGRGLALPQAGEPVSELQRSCSKLRKHAQFEREIQLYCPAVTTNNAQKDDAAAPG
jgi:hypothetical protein